MSFAQVSHLPNSTSPWKVPEVDGGLKLTSKLLGNVLDLGVQSPNHSLKAQHLLSRGIEILISVQHYLQSGEKDLLGALQTLNDLQATENVLTESIVILHDDVKEAESLPCDRAVMSSWHLNRNTFTAKLEELADTRQSKKDKNRWSAVMKDVVRADDLSFVTRLSEDVEKNCQDDKAKDAVKSIVASLDSAPTEADEKTRTDSILGIMCLADEANRPMGAGMDSVVRVVGDMAERLKQPDKEKWKSISERLHGLPVCRKVEKPLLIHEGRYTIPAVIEDAQAEVLSAGASIGEIVPLDISDPTVRIDEELIAKAKKYVEQIGKAMAEGTRNLEALSKKKSFTEVVGEKNYNQISYAAVHLFGNIAMALTPAVEVSALREPVNLVTASVSKFINALTAFKKSPGEKWKATLLRSLENTVKVLTAFGEEAKNEAVTKAAAGGVNQEGGAESGAGSLETDPTQPATEEPKSPVPLSETGNTQPSPTGSGSETPTTGGT
ncbi:hypothetical protein FRC04_000709 [Tulasnella sp. 424]|nr:hypothetical protein FRC04_000709 [Tulasnella sp. 424]